MRDNITGKKILLIGDPFYGYCSYIKKQLLCLGAKSVCYIQNTFYLGSFRDNINFPTFISWIRHPKIRTNWTNKLINDLGDGIFDTFFVVQKLPFKKSFIEYLRERNPNIRTILFLWDTFRTQQSRYHDYLPLFDKVYSFDKDDAERYHLSYFPDFYIEDIKIPIERCKFDVAFIGTMDENETHFRGKVLAKISDFCKAEGLTSFFYLRYYNIDDSKNIVKKLYKKISCWKYYKDIEKLKQYGFMHQSAMPLSDYNDIMSNTKAIIDISHRERQGMTINAITALANGKKLITTNDRIKNEIFYDPQMISIINEKSPHIDLDFLRGPYISLNMSFLRIDSWLKHVVNEM